jgi:hypothetical protein
MGQSSHQAQIVQPSSTTTTTTTTTVFVSPQTPPK